MKRSDARMRKPFEYTRRPSYKPLNTSTVRVKHGSKYRKGDGQLKSTVNLRRINKELMRHKLALASFIPAAFLMNPKTGCCVKAVAI
jgi:hypothetical protein